MRCGIAIGSNIGDRLDNLRRARDQILAAPEWHPPESASGPVLCASIYETEPVDCPTGSAAFLNSVLELSAHPQTTPGMILDRLQSIERMLGRPSRHPRNSPRTIDLDLLYLADLELSTNDLTLPHPRLRQRRFVLAPLAEIRPDLILPGDSRTVAQWLEKLPDTGRIVRLLTAW